MKSLESLQIQLSRRALIGSGALLSAGLAFGAAPTRAASSVGMESGWPSVSALLDRYVTQRKLPGALATYGWGDGPMAQIARGTEGFDDLTAVSANSLFRLYSMTKPVTGMAAMMLIDEGKLRLDSKLADYAPEFAQMQVAVDPAKGLESRPATAQITIRHLLTHTSGMGYAGITPNKIGAELFRLGLLPASISHLAIPGVTSPVPTPGPDEFLRRAATVPLLAEPGTRWNYSMGLDVLGIVIQRASGAKSFAAFLQERLFDPAGMTSSFFQVKKIDTERLATNYGLLGGVPIPIDRPANSIYLDPVPFAFGGSGLVSAPADYDRFQQMLVGRGMVGRKRIMRERAVALGTSNLLPAGVSTAGTMANGSGFGAGGRVGLGAEEGLFGWSGAAGTVGFVNMRIGLRAGLYVQFMPPETYPLQREFLAATRDDVLVRLRR